MVVPLSGIHLPHSFRVSVSLLSKTRPTNLSNSAKNSALSVSCAPSTDVSGYAPGLVSWEQRIMMKTQSGSLKSYLRQPEKNCKLQSTNQYNVRSGHWFVRYNLQIFSGCVCHLEQLHAQSRFVFPIILVLISSHPAVSSSIFVGENCERNCLVFHVKKMQKKLQNLNWCFPTIDRGKATVEKRKLAAFLNDFIRPPEMSHITDIVKKISCMIWRSENKDRRKFA